MPTKIPNPEVEAIKSAIRRVSGEKPRFTADDVRRAVGFEPSHPNYWGAAFRALKRTEIKPVRGATSKTESRNGGHLYEWVRVGGPGIKPLTGWV